MSAVWKIVASRVSTRTETLFGGKASSLLSEVRWEDFLNSTLSSTSSFFFCGVKDHIIGQTGDTTRVRHGTEEHKKKLAKAKNMTEAPSVSECLSLTGGLILNIVVLVPQLWSLARGEKLHPTVLLTSTRGPFSSSSLSCVCAHAGKALVTLL